MDDREFLDQIYQLWSKTTGAGERYWMPVKYSDRTDRHKMYACRPDGQQVLVGSDMPEPDAEFVAGVHGALPELISLMHRILDESDRVDLDRDSRECRIAELELEVASLREVVDGLSTTPPWNETHD